MRGMWAAMAALALAMTADAQAPRPDEAAFRALYEELVEIDTSPSTGSCTRAAEAMAAHLRAAGFGEADLRVIVPEGKPDDGNLTAVLRGSNPRAGALLLLAHIDVVDARREDWERDPFTLFEENGYFYGRGTIDDKAMAAIFADLMIRLKRENFRPRRDVKLALTCGEETSNRVNGVRYLLEHHRDLIDASVALNEGAGGILRADGTPLALNIQAGEKVHQVFVLETTNPGGHSSRPRADNAIYQLNAAVARIAAHDFPVALNPVTQSFFARMADLEGGALGAAMRALAADPTNAEAIAQLSREPSYNAMMRTTCIATRLDAGHAPNALPQRARATFSCRLLPGHASDAVRAELARVIADPGVSITLANGAQPTPPPPPLTPALMRTVERHGRHFWPDAPLVPIMLPGATDGRFLNAAGVPTYGLSGIFSTPDETNAHGLNEKVRVASVYRGRDFLDAVVRDLARQSR
ncbi:MAG: M20/M25/M40 family metallo-hydrolase [Hyphomonadaceae bacterium]|nr:M20/M25/M40 family metallo-hydrolase [Hyphomonadaceae bacterium]